MHRVLWSLILVTAWLPQGTPSICVKHIVSPQYPQLVRLARISGDVTVKVTVSADGKVIAADPVSGPPTLMPAAALNVKEWLFDKGEDRHFEIVYKFRLKDPPSDYSPPAEVIFDLPSSVEIISHYGTPNN